MSSIGNLGEMISDMKAGVFDYTDNGQCTNCGQCCGNILPVGEGDVKRIKEYIRKNGIKAQVRNYPTANPLLDMQCPFRDEINKKCTIYAVRPAICRDFKCDKPKQNIVADRTLYEKSCRIVDMRHEFYGSEKLATVILRNMFNEK